MTSGNWYEVLGVPPGATAEEIQKAYHQLALTFHPDVRKAPDAEERMKEINAAYGVLGDPEKRKQYDEELRKKEPPRVRPYRHRHKAGSPHDGPPPPPPGETPRDRQHWEPPRYGPVRDTAPPRSAQQKHRGMPYAAGVLVLLLILVVLWMGTPQTPVEKPPVQSPVQPQVTTAAPLITSPLAVTPQKTFDDWKSEGDGYALLGQNWEAIAAYNQALKMRPDASSLWVIQGDMYNTMGYFNNAVTCYDRALAADPSAGNNLEKKISVLANAESLMDDAERAVHTENYSTAIGIYDDIVSVGVRNTRFQKRVLSAKLYALMRAGRTDEAEQVSRTIATI
jgi:tetratricopeptide (TPR) repeat protein